MKKLTVNEIIMIVLAIIVIIIIGVNWSKITKIGFGPWLFAEFGNKPSGSTTIQTTIMITTTIQNTSKPIEAIPVKGFVTEIEVLPLPGYSIERVFLGIKGSVSIDGSQLWLIDDQPGDKATIKKDIIFFDKTYLINVQYSNKMWGNEVGFYIRINDKKYLINRNNIDKDANEHEIYFHFLLIKMAM